jgi:hypothetical protein
MRRKSILSSIAVSLPLCTAAFAACAADVAPRFDLSSPTTSPFPSNLFSTPDPGQLTGLRVVFPKPDCAVHVSDCQDIEVINTLDGFNVQPRITIPFTGQIDLATVTGETVFLIGLGVGNHRGARRVALNQVAWDSLSNTLIGKSDELLEQHTRYLLVITDGVKDKSGAPLETKGYRRALADGTADRATRAYVRSLDTVLRTAGVERRHVAAASLFTTQSVTADLEKVRAQIRRTRPAPIDFDIAIDVEAGKSGETTNPTKAVFAPSSFARIQFHRQTGVGTESAAQFNDTDVFTKRLDLAPGSIAQIAYGRFFSPDYETREGYISAYPTRNGVPAPQRYNALVVEIFVPSGTKPTTGWPVAIIGHGLGESIYNDPWAIAPLLASEGIATAAINVVGHGGGEHGMLIVHGKDGRIVVVPAGGRGIDQNGDGRIGPSEGFAAMTPRSILSRRDGSRQTVIDLMQLVREIEIGVDIDGDGVADLDPNRIYYAGHSAGGIYGALLLAVEASIKAGALVAAGGSAADYGRLGIFRSSVGRDLAERKPSLINVAVSEDPAKPSFLFVDNIPLRDQPPFVNTVPGAIAIQQRIEHGEWVAQSGNPVAYAKHIRKAPLPNNVPKPVLLQFAKGDKSIPNPTTSAIIHAGDLQDRTTLYRADLAYAANPTGMPKNPHNFIFDGVDTAERPYALMAQKQIAIFFKTNGVVIIDPNGREPIFEVPIAGPLPEGLSFIP